MKNVIFSIILLLFAARSFCQIESSPKLSKEYYLQKSKNQKTAAWILLSAGVGMQIAGVAMFASQPLIFFGPEPPGYNPNKGEGLFFVGLASSLASIPLFMSAKKNKKRAASLTINNQIIHLPLQNSFEGKVQPAICLKIEL